MVAPPLKEAEEQVRVRVEREKRIRGKVGREKAKKLSKKYNKQSCYLLLIYEPQAKTPTDAIPVRTQPTLEAVLKDLEELGLYPLIHPQRIYVPQSFWEEYRLAQDSSQRLELVRKYGLLRDSSIYRFDTVVIDVDSPFESVYPVWNELRERLALKSGYQVYKTKSGRFRAYIYLLDGTKDLKRAQELQTVIYAFFEKRGFKADRTFVHRLNHPVFYEEFSLYSYELIEEREGRVSFFWLYRSVKRFQKEEKLYTLGNINLTQHFWNKRPSTKQQSQRKKGKIIKAPAFCRRLQMEKLDVERLWEKAVITLARKHSSYRYIHVIQPAVGWAKYLELDKDYVTEFLVSLLGEEKRKDVEKGWKYVRELEFIVPEEITWLGRTREEWEGEVIAYLRTNGEVERQKLIPDVFHGQKWLCDEIMEGLCRKGLVSYRFVACGRGRPKKVFSLAESLRIPLRKAVGSEYEIMNALLDTGKKVELPSSSEEKEFSHMNINSPVGRAMGGGWYKEKDTSSSLGVYNADSRGCELKGNSGSAALDFDGILFSALRDNRVVFDLVELSGKVRKDVWVVSFSVPKRLLVLSDGPIQLSQVGRLNFGGKDAVRFFKEVIPKLPESVCLSSFGGKPVYLYPYGLSPEKWELVKCAPYFYVLHKVEFLRGRKTRKVHSYSVVYKLSLSAFTLFAPYREDLISVGEPVGPHEAGVWREELKETTKLLLEEFKGRKVSKLLVTVALKDGREITGVMKRRTGFKGFFYTLLDPDNPKAKIFIFKHAVDDFWVEE